MAETILKSKEFETSKESKDLIIDICDDEKWFHLLDVDEENTELIYYFKRFDTIPVRFDKFEKVWKCWSEAASKEDFEHLKRTVGINVHFSKSVQSYFDGVDRRKEVVKIPYDFDNIETKFDDIKIEAYPFQSAGVKFIDEVVDEKTRKGVLVADVQGLGKTLEFLIHIVKKKKKALVICDAGLKLNWAEEIKKCTNLSYYVLDSSFDEYDYSSALLSDVIIINYEMTWRRLKELILLAVDRVIGLDEVQSIKDWTTKKSRGTAIINTFGLYTIAMTGTPIVNRPKELWQILQVINRSFFKHRKAFLRRYCPGANASGAANLDELNEKIKHFMLRRLKSEVCLQLPDKRWIPRSVELDNRKEYDYAERNFIKWVERKFGKESAGRAALAEAIVRMNRLRQLSANGKFSSCKLFIEECVDYEEPVIMFASHRDILIKLKEQFKDKAAMIIGGVSMKKRNEIKNDFQDGKYDVLLGSTRTCKRGLTLTRARISCFIDFPWTPGAMCQASDRIHRIGQDRDCDIYKLVSKGIDEKMDSIIADKIKILDAVTGDKGKVDSLSNESIAGDLLKLYGGNLNDDYYDEDLVESQSGYENEWYNW